MIRNPLEWAADQSKNTSHAIRSAVSAVHPADVQIGTELPQIQRITPADLRDVLAKGFDDFGKNRTDVVFLCFLYPVLGLIFARLASGNNMLPLVFPMASGFALLGPLVGVGLYEMSRLREQGVDGGWTAAFRVILSPSFGAIILLGLLLTAIFVFWLAAAEVIYMITLGPLPPVSIGSFAHDVLTTPAGWVMMGLGLAVGFIFALLVLVISVVSFPLLLDRHVGVDVAVTTSVGAVIANPGPMALWGLIVASALVIGSIPLFFGLVIVLPVLGHATWHLYRKVVAR
jgi:uncharacterized membrane protein